MITLKNIYKNFGNKIILHDLNLHVNTGESFVIIGSSGSGKSVILKCMLGLLLPDSGTILINQEDIIKASEKKYRKILSSIGVLFQSTALFENLSVWENIAFRVIQSRSLSRLQARNLAYDNLNQVGLEKKVLDLLPSELSGGMKKRVALARAISCKPKILFFDEPTTGLDPINSTLIDNLIIRSVKTLGATAITITHNIPSVYRIADRVGFLYQGNFLWNGEINKLDTCNNQYIKQFIRG